MSGYRRNKDNFNSKVIANLSSSELQALEELATLAGAGDIFIESYQTIIKTIGGALASSLYNARDEVLKSWGFSDRDIKNRGSAFKLLNDEGKALKASNVWIKYGNSRGKKTQVNSGTKVRRYLAQVDKVTYDNKNMPQNIASKITFQTVFAVNHFPSRLISYSKDTSPTSSNYFGTVAGVKVPYLTPIKVDNNRPRETKPKSDKQAIKQVKREAKKAVARAKAKQDTKGASVTANNKLDSNTSVLWFQHLKTSLRNGKTLYQPQEPERWQSNIKVHDYQYSYKVIKARDNAGNVTKQVVRSKYERNSLRQQKQMYIIATVDQEKAIVREAYKLESYLNEDKITTKIQNTLTAKLKEIQGSSSKARNKFLNEIKQQIK